MACILSIETAAPSMIGRANDGARLAELTLTSATVPGGPYSGCPRSRSSTAMAGDCRFESLEAPVSNLFPRIRPKVDLPEDFGPVIRITGLRPSRGVVSSASFLFHAGRETSSWTTVRFGKSFDVWIYFESAGAWFELLHGRETHHLISVRLHTLGTLDLVP